MGFEANAVYAKVGAKIDGLIDAMIETEIAKGEAKIAMGAAAANDSSTYQKEHLWDDLYSTALRILSSLLRQSDTIHFIEPVNRRVQLGTDLFEDHPKVRIF